MGTILRVPEWESGPEHRFLAVNPARDEVSLHISQYDSSSNVQNLTKAQFRGGFDSIHCMNFSPARTGLLAVGQLNGSVSVLDITDAASPVVQLRPRQARPCNAVTFNSDNLLAVGLDKVRSDFSLQIWDTNRYSASVPSSSASAPASGGIAGGSQPSATVHSDLFGKPVYHSLLGEVVSSLAFFSDSPHSLVCGSYKFLREIDIRQPASSSPIMQCATRCVHGICMDPYDSNLFASYSEEGSVALWDRRQLRQSAGSSAAEPLLYFNRLLADNSRKNHHTCFRYSGVRSGEFSVLSAGDLLRRWQLGRSPPALGKDGPDFSRTLFVANVLDVKTKLDKIVSFDYCPDPVVPAKVGFVCMRMSGLVFRTEAVESPYAVRFSPENGMAVAGVDGTLLLYPTELARQMGHTGQKLDSETRAELGVVGTVEKSDVESETAAQSDTSSVAEAVGHLGISDSRLGSQIPAPEVLDRDVCSVIRKRALAGYALDAGRNAEMLGDVAVLGSVEHLHNTWKWLRLGQEFAQSRQLCAGGFDLGYEGVGGIWTGVPGLVGQARYFGKSGGAAGPVGNGIIGVSPSGSSSAAPSSATYESALQEMVTGIGKRTFPVEQTFGKTHGPKSNLWHRRLCLHVLGFSFGLDELDDKLAQLVAMGQPEKAAAWAVFHGDVDRAVGVLARANSERLKLISAAIAGYPAFHTRPENSPWKEQCRQMAQELENPYLRAVFAFIADSDWWEVLDECALPLRERLGVALRFLSDSDLSVYLQRVAQQAVKEGQLEGLLVTGVTPDGIKLLQAYVDRTGDVQTAALVSAFGTPRYFTAPRAEQWTAAYRELLNQWRLFALRARFDVARARLSVAAGGTGPTLRGPPRQVYLQCSRCNGSISKQTSATRKAETVRRFFSRAGRGSGGESGKAGIAGAGAEVTCPHCRAPLPRCAVCLLPLGSSAPILDVASAEAQRDVAQSDPGKEENCEEAGKSATEHAAADFKRWFSFCLSCNHGMHAGHAEEWFAKHYVCPVPDCNCKCNTV